MTEPLQPPRPGSVNWDEIGPKVRALFEECEKKRDSLSDYDRRELDRMRSRVEEVGWLNHRDIASLHLIASGSGAL